MRPRIIAAYAVIYVVWGSTFLATRLDLQPVAFNAAPMSVGGGLLRHSSAVSVGTFAYVSPAIAIVLGWALLGESLAPAQVTGILVVLAAGPARAASASR